MTTSQSTTDRARDAASTAQEEGRNVAGVATEEAQKVASETAQQAKNLIGDAVSQVSEQAGEQARTQQDRVVALLQGFGDDLGAMSAEAGSDSIATQAAREVAERARTLAQHLESREPGELLDDVRDFARRRPGTFLLGALVAGVVAGRVLRGAKESPATGSSQGPEYGTPPTQSAQAAPAVPTPPSEPTYGTPPGETGSATTEPPRPSATPGQPTIAVPMPDDVAPMGTPAAGYGDRGGDQP